MTAELDGVRIIAWKGNPYDLLLPSVYSRPIAQSISAGTYDGSIDYHSMSLKIERRTEAYFLAKDFSCPLTLAADEPPEEFRDACINWNGKYYMVSDRTMLLPEAQRIAVTLKGRLLTISSRSS